MVSVDVGGKKIPAGAHNLDAILLFVSGVFWDVNAVADADVRRWLLLLNPLATLIDAYRQILLLGSLPKTDLMSVLLCQSLLLLSIAIGVYRIFQSRIALRVLSR